MSLCPLNEDSPTAFESSVKPCGFIRGWWETNINDVHLFFNDRDFGYFHGKSRAESGKGEKNIAGVCIRVRKSAGRENLSDFLSDLLDLSCLWSFPRSLIYYFLNRSTLQRQRRYIYFFASYILVPPVSRCLTNLSDRYIKQDLLTPAWIQSHPRIWLTVWVPEDCTPQKADYWNLRINITALRDTKSYTHPCFSFSKNALYLWRNHTVRCVCRKSCQHSGFAFFFSRRLPEINRITLLY